MASTTKLPQRRQSTLGQSELAGGQKSRSLLSSSTKDSVLPIDRTPPPHPRPSRAPAPRIPSASSQSTAQSSHFPYHSPVNPRQRAVTHTPDESPLSTPSKNWMLSDSLSPPNPYLSAVWPVSGVLDSKHAALMEKSPNSLRRHLSADEHPDLTLNDLDITREEWHAENDQGEEDFDMITEIDDESVVEEDLLYLLRQIKVYHNRQIAHYKRLLETANFSTSSQIHALQAEVRLLRSQLNDSKGNLRQLELSKLHSQPHAQNPIDGLDPWGILSSSLGPGFDEKEVKRAVKALPRAERRRLVAIILDAMLPSDISEQIRVLDKYARSAFDIVGLLPKDISINIVKCLTVYETVKVSTVSKTWYELMHYPLVWQYYTTQLTIADPYPPGPPALPDGWEALYRSLHHRESNFKHGIPQDITFLSGHTNFVTTLILKGKRLISGSYDETIRFWDIQSGRQIKCLNVKKPVSCIDFLAEDEVFVCGFHDVGRVHLFSSVTYTPLQQLQGHLYGIRAVALSSKHLVSAGADKALVCWDWRLGTKIVRFGQQTNLNIGVQIIGSANPEQERVVSVTIDGVVRVFSIQRREMISQFKLSELSVADNVLAQRIANVGAGATNMLQWFAANGNQMTSATKNTILHLEWDDYQESDSPIESLLDASSPVSPVGSFESEFNGTSNQRTGTQGRMAVSKQSNSGAPSPTVARRASGPASSLGNSLTKSRPVFKPSVSVGALAPATLSPVSKSTNRPRFSRIAPPRVVGVVETPEVAVGVMDARKRRVVTATRFSSRAGAERKIYVSTQSETSKPSACTTEYQPEEKHQAPYYDSATTCLTGAWAALEFREDPDGAPSTIKGLQGELPKEFKGLAAPNMNPMSMALSHEEVVVGCADGTIYVMSMLGYQYRVEDTNSGRRNPVEHLDEFKELSESEDEY